jgi:hypothetical protein
MIFIDESHTKGPDDILNMDCGCEQWSLSYKILVRNPCIFEKFYSLQSTMELDIPLTKIVTHRLK